MTVTNKKYSSKTISKQININFFSNESFQEESVYSGFFFGVE